MSQIGIDLMRLKQTDGYSDEMGYNYMITAVCYFTKFVELGALFTKEGQETGKWIYDNIFCQYSVTDIHITDRGGNSATMLLRNYIIDLELDTM